MALRAGYYGIKRGLKAKLTEIASAWDNLVDVVTTLNKIHFLSFSEEKTVATGGQNVDYDERITAAGYTSYDVLFLVGSISGANSAEGSSLKWLDTSQAKARLHISNSTGESKTWVIKGHLIIKEVDPSREVTASPEDVPEEVIEEPVTKKRSTKKTVKEGE